ncbi:putative protein N(5)-glutamine methyltransferase [Streptantibioticus silvisoli]|uniref:peptide chain release factor N(5)-glutamine methyltransferase n=1 Tax=Streptantibioticus silvisoli TaxID=2705255 RepID=A0ABT6VYT7_9ACTN|nr:putative protein N(5)-glutamine methyltransferase [Streptantibioticus silvisoli]MDI5963657.1 putative protein N(5)-glutamine methyltransferase [Streptantibioticus silvisoli]
MSATPSVLSFSLIVGRLRGAGCVFAEDEAELLLSTAPDQAALAAMVVRREQGEPLEHVLGWAEFDGARYAVDPGVFVPRRRTEFLVGRAAALARDITRPVVVDLCCGSGAIGAALAARLDGATLHACDIDPAAVRCARRNVAGVGGVVHQGDLYDALPQSLRGRIDVLLANVPYVPTGAIALLPPEARDHEPLVALDGGADGLAVMRRVTAAARDWLAPGGHLFVETSERQAPHAVDAFTHDGLSARLTACDELGATVVHGTRPTA